MNCPNCGNSTVVKKGTRAGKQRYKCTSCKATLTEGVPYRALPTYKKLNIKCIKCGSSHVIRDGVFPDGTQRYECRDCGLNFTNKTNTLLFKEISWKCPYCGGRLKQYAYNKKGRNKYECKRCGKTCTGDEKGEPIKRTPFVRHDSHCPSCGSHNLKRSGISKNRQRYTCKDCGRAFVENPEVIVHDKNIEEEVINLILLGHNPSKIVKIYHYSEDRLRRVMAPWYATERITKEQAADIIKYGIHLNVPVDYMAEYIKCSEKKCKEVIKNYKKKYLCPPSSMPS